MVIDIRKFLTKFASEAVEHCNQLEAGLLAMENATDRKESIDTAFRSAHTLKGTARMLKLESIMATAHCMEDVLDELRDGRLAFSQELSDVLLLGVDAIRSLVADMAAGRPLPAEPPSACRQLRQVLQRKQEEEEIVVAGAENSTAGQIEQTEQTENVRTSATEATQNTDFVRVGAGKLDDLIKLMGEFLGQHSRTRHHIDEFHDIVRLAANTMNSAAVLADRDELGREVHSGIHRLHSKLVQLQALLRDDLSMESHLTEELQERSLKMRMVPLAATFEPFQRLVRDLARSAGKEIDFRIDAGNTELDRKLLEQIGTALMHMLRNAVDHGIESPEERLRAGKPARGSICLTAYYDTGGVSITLHDDGAGISLARVRETVLQRRLVSEQALGQMTEREVLELIFLPGFSTSPIITDLSGRGVGMDVVRKSIVDSLKGSVQISTREGQGTTVSIKVPITLALSRMLLVTAAKYTFAVPAHFIKEVVSVHAANIINVINKRAIRLREQLIPVEELGILLGCPGAVRKERSEMLIVIVQFGSEKLGLIVDQLLDEMDAVIKPMPPVLAKLQLVSGMTISGNKQMISVLNMATLIHTIRDAQSQPAELMSGSTQQQMKTILVVDDSVNTRELEKSILESYGYQVDLADDGLSALEKLNRRMYDAIVTDVEMPKLDGFSLTMRLRQDERYREVPIIIVTSRARDEDRRRGIQLGANAYIVKGSFDQNNLIDTMRNLIG